METEKDISLLLLREISNNTDVWVGWSILLTILTILASVVTIIGVFKIVLDMQTSKVSKERQRLIVKDVVRHLFINAAIMEVVRMKMEDHWGKLHPQEGVFARFCVLDSDMQLSQIKVKDGEYTKLHSLSLFLRNYNIMAQLVEKHFGDSQYDTEELKLEIADLWERTKRISNDFIELGEKSTLKISKESIRKFIVDHYKEKELKREAPLPEIPIPERDGVRAYYDDANNLALSKTFDFCIRDKYDGIRVIPFQTE